MGDKSVHCSRSVERSQLLQAVEAAHTSSNIGQKGWQSGMGRFIFLTIFPLADQSQLFSCLVDPSLSDPPHTNQTLSQPFLSTICYTKIISLFFLYYQSQSFCQPLTICPPFLVPAQNIMDLRNCSLSQASKSFTRSTLRNSLPGQTMSTIFRSANPPQLAPWSNQV